MTTKICQHCKELFKTKPRAGKRKYCYRPECTEKEKIRLAKHNAYLAREWRKNRIKDHLCTCCHCEPIAATNHFLCNRCFREAREMFEVDTGYKIDRTYSIGN